MKGLFAICSVLFGVFFIQIGYSLDEETTQRIMLKAWQKVCDQAGVKLVKK